MSVRKKRILFIGEMHSSHAQSWVKLVNTAEWDIRCFSLPYGAPPSSFPFLCYLTSHAVSFFNPRRKGLPVGLFHLCKLLDRTVCKGLLEKFAMQWLRFIIYNWQPDLIHSFGLMPTSLLVYQHLFHSTFSTPWILQLRGGSDLFFTHRHIPPHPLVVKALNRATHIISDNRTNISYMETIGVQRAAPFITLIAPGTGGLPLAELQAKWSGLPSQRRTIVWPKAYESTWSKAAPVLEALRLSEQALSDAEFIFLAVSEEVEQWVTTLPSSLQKRCTLHRRISHADSIALLLSARIMLAPSLVDGTPNVMWEAMATGAVPIVSPLVTLEGLVHHEKEVLFARNLYPEEIAEALTCAWQNHSLVDAIAIHNRTFVTEHADRTQIQLKVEALYKTA